MPSKQCCLYLISYTSPFLEETMMLLSFWTSAFPVAIIKLYFWSTNQLLINKYTVKGGKKRTSQGRPTDEEKKTKTGIKKRKTDHKNKGLQAWRGILIKLENIIRSIMSYRKNGYVCYNSSLYQQRAYSTFRGKTTQYKCKRTYSIKGKI